MVYSAQVEESSAGKDCPLTCPSSTNTLIGLSLILKQCQMHLLAYFRKGARPSSEAIASSFGLHPRSVHYYEERDAACVVQYRLLLIL